MSELCLDEQRLALADRMVEQRCGVYRARFAIEVFRDPLHGHIAAYTGSETAGVLAPRALAAAACELLAGEPVPVFAVGTDRWAFITQGAPDSTAAQQLSWSVFTHPIVGSSPLFPWRCRHLVTDCGAGYARPMARLDRRYPWSWALS